MQRISNRMGYTIDHLYSISGTVGLYNSGSNVNYEENNAFSLFLKVGFQGDRIELPVFGRSIIQSALYNEVQDGSRKDIVIPFVRGTDNEAPPIYRTADSLLRYLAEYSSYIDSMYGVAKTNKEEMYYGANGLLFDKDMNLLFMSVIEGDIEGQVLVLKKIKVYVHPSVFYSDGTIEKCIINKVLPRSLQGGVTVYGGVQDTQIKNLINYTDPNDYRTRRKAFPEVIITDIKDKFFIKPIVPSVSYSNDEVNELLDRNINDVFSIMKL